jgi:hypothetical protein
MQLDLSAESSVGVHRSIDDGAADDNSKGSPLLTGCIALHESDQESVGRSEKMRVGGDQPRDRIHAKEA